MSTGVALRRREETCGIRKTQINKDGKMQDRDREPGLSAEGRSRTLMRGFSLWKETEAVWKWPTPGDPLDQECFSGGRWRVGGAPEWTPVCNLGEQISGITTFFKAQIGELSQLIFAVFASFIF